MPTATANSSANAKGVATRAVSIGPGLPTGSFSLRVLAVHRQAINLRLEGSGLVLSLVGPSNEGEPAAISLGKDRDFRSWLPEIVTTGYIDDDRLELRDAFDVLRAEINLVKALRLDPTAMPHIAKLGNAWNLARSELALIQARRSTELRIGELNIRDRGQGLAPSPLLRAILELSRAPLSPSREAFVRIAGSGQGLTPAGDDFLVGFAGATVCVEGRAGDRRGTEGIPCPPRLLADGLLEGAKFTTELSATQLRLASRGIFSAYLGALAEGIASEDSPKTIACLRRLCTIGHSSGADTATGFLYGLGLLSGRADGIGHTAD